MHKSVENFLQRHQLSQEVEVDLLRLLESVRSETLRQGRSVPSLPDSLPAGMSSEDMLGETLASFEMDAASCDTLVLEGAEVATELKSRAFTPPARASAGFFAKAEERYEELGVLGEGGMGQIMRVKDRHLNRVVAMKRLKPGLQQNSELVRRFVEEARATSQLQHPGIVPVYEMGRSAGGSFFFTMKEIKGRTLTKAIREAHDTFQKQQSEQDAAGRFRFRGLIDIFHRVCETVAYAHKRGVLHRDLKPDNIMLGEHGEALVVDWGLVKLTDEEVGVEQSSVSGELHSTQVGVIKGTPAYMSPEQASGATDRVGPQSDVYALGTILYEILSGRPPIGGDSIVEMLSHVIRGDILPPGRVDTVSMMVSGTRWDKVFHASNPSFEGLLLPAALVQICDKALALEPEERFADAGELAFEVARWLEGAQQRERGLAVVHSARELFPKIKALSYQAEMLNQQAEVMLEGVDSWESEEKKIMGWEVQDQAQQKEREAQLLQLETEQLLQGALTHTPDLIEAHTMLCSIYEGMHRRSEEGGDTELVIRAEKSLLSHIDALPKEHPKRLRHMAYLKGDGAVSLVTDPPGVAVRLFRYEKRRRRLVPEFVRLLGQTPLVEVPLAQGSYLLILQKEGYEDIHYPVQIGRQEHWSGVAPNDSEPGSISMCRTGEQPLGACYVPMGWFQAGGDEKARGCFAKQKVWLDSFWIQKFPVTHREYLKFLNSLVRSGREGDAVLHAPRRRSAQGERYVMLYQRSEDGLFLLEEEEAPRLYLPEQPVVCIRWSDGEAYAKWLSEETGRAWRLPCEMEWEKAARGVDGRFYPWGNFLDPSWVCMSLSHRSQNKSMHMVDSFPIDESPYGVRGMGGNVRGWCIDLYHPSGPPVDNHRLQRIHRANHVEPPKFMQRSIRGGSWTDDANIVRCAFRSWRGEGFRNTNVGLRLVQSSLHE